MKKALIVVDMINDFCEPEGAMARSLATGIVYANSVVNNIKERIHQHNGPVIWLCCGHENAGIQPSRYPIHAVKSSWGAEVISSLKTDAQDPNSIVIHKPVCFNAFYKTGLGFFLHKIRIDRAEVAGVRASESVLGVVHGLRTRNIPTSVPINCVADPDTSAERFALKQMKKLYGVKVI